MIDQYLADLDARLRVSKRNRARILVEVRDHLDDAVARGRAEDLRPDLAVERAVDEFGPAMLIATEFNAIAGTRAMRQAIVVAISAGTAVVLGFLVAVTTQPHSRVANGASIAAQVSFFAAALALQTAIVAGARGASRVLAVGRGPAARAADRRLVHRCAVTCIGALCITAIGWSACIGLAAGSLGHPNRATLAAGAVLMMSVAAIATVATTRLDVNPDDDATDAQTCGRGAFALGERAFDLVRRHQITACAALAAIAAPTAMSHAETTVAAAIPWGVLQTAAVVLGFVLLGPSLGLRETGTA
jgi:hypothetical protein